jgi:lipid II:glycine glycyltransferase (peptidoglycan interpeptide bridge formation enzyme)
MFIKFEPPLPRLNEHFFVSQLKNADLRATRFIQPQDTLYLDLSLPEDKLAEALHPKTRYNIRLAERKGVGVRQDGAVNDFDDFWKLMEMTAKRDTFQHHRRAYYREMYRILGQTGFLKMFLAEYQGKVIAANLVVLFGDCATYVHGASGDDNREVMAPHLLQWRQIIEAKKSGFKYYDFWGIAPTGADEKHPWQGLTRFKSGFSGRQFNYLGAYDLILDTFWYRIYKTVQRLRF